MKPILIRGCLLAFALSALAIEPVKPGGFIVGVCTHFSQGKGLLPANLSLIRQAGARSIRDEVVWRGVETEKGQLRMPADWENFVKRAAAEGLDPMLILDYGNKFYDGGDKPRSEEAMEAFTRYSEFVVRTFKGVVRHYEVWNEWDIKIGGGTPGSAEDYTRLIRQVYPRIKAIDPSIVVYGGAMTPGAVNNGWLEKMMAGGALAYMDVVSIHTYNYGRPGRERTPEAWAEWMQKVQDLIAKYNDGRQAPLYITEMGWPTQIDKRGTPPPVSADFLARMYLLSRTMPFLKGIWWYDFQDDGWKAAYNEDNFGIVRPDLSPKPSFYALAAVAELVAQAGYLGRADAGDPDVYILKFRAPGGKEVWAIWSAHEDDDWQVALKSSRSNPEPVSLMQLGAPAVQRPWGSRDWPGQRNAPVLGDHLTLVVRGTPWIVSGDLSGVTVSGVTRRPFPEATRSLTNPVEAR
jgi:hypothetical protein